MYLTSCTGKREKALAFVERDGLLGKALQRADFLLESCFCLSRELRVERTDASDTTGVYTAEEWARARNVQTAPFMANVDRYGSDAAYLKYLESIHDGKILPVFSLMRTFDFTRYQRIIELGCGDMPQAYTISSRYPGITYTASDFDSSVIEHCSHVPLLRRIRKRVLDAANADPENLEGHDLVISWSLEFSLDDLQLTRLFAACKTCSLPYLLCSHTTIGPLALLAKPEARSSRRIGRDGRRLLGWLRSTGAIARLARRAGMVLASRSYHVNHAVLFFIPA